MAAAEIRVHPEHLLVSGVRADLHAEDLHAQHTASIGRIENAQPGMPTAAAAAISAKVARWQAVTTALHTRIAGHGRALHSSGVDFLETEQANSRAIRAVAAEAGEVERGR